MINKKGLSPIIATVLVILITISAAVIVSQIVIPFTKEKLYGSTECLPYIDYLKFQELAKSNCLQGNNMLVTIKANRLDKTVNSTNNDLTNNLNKISLVFTGKDGSKAYDIPSADVHLLNFALPVKVPNEGDIFTYNVSLGVGEKYNRIELRSGLNSGKVCPSSDSINIVQCIQ